MKYDFNKRVEDLIKELSKFPIKEEDVEAYLVVELENLCVQLEVAFEGINFCIKNREYLKKLKKLNHKYSIYH